jgi:serine/threonine protein kinase
MDGPSHVARPTLTGTTIGAYRILSLLGAGGMGEVYTARDRQLERDVALKVLPEAFSHDQLRIDRFRREAQLLAALNHPDIATIHGLEEADGAIYLVMELVPGQTLAERLHSGRMPLDETLRVCVNGPKRSAPRISAALRIATSSQPTSS